MKDIMPKLLDFDWRVDIKMASNINSNETNRTSGQQTCILQLKVIILKSNYNFLCIKRF
jgi:hypothetical protein